ASKHRFHGSRGKHGKRFHGKPGMRAFGSRGQLQSSLPLPLGRLVRGPGGQRRSKQRPLRQVRGAGAGRKPAASPFRRQSCGGRGRLAGGGGSCGDRICSGHLWPSSSRGDSLGADGNAVRFALVAPEPRQRGRRGCGAELGAAELPAELLAAEALARSQPGR
ncbi:unnamed protein product, partial [Effrenium voratum]